MGIITDSKIINKIEHVSHIKYLNSEIEKFPKNLINDKKNQKSLTRKIKVREETKKEKKPRTLWIRKKKAS